MAKNVNHVMRLFEKYFLASVENERPLVFSRELTEQEIFCDEDLIERTLMLSGFKP